MKRRDFIKHSSLATTSLMIPGFLKAFDTGHFAYNGKILVVIQLSGGNDGLNTVIPYHNDLYYNMRPGLAISRDEALYLTDEMGLHPSMTGIRELYDQGWLSMINNVGYPNPNRSHFRSMDIWHSASDSDEVISTGWLGRYLDAACHNGKPVSTALEVDDSLSLAMKGAEYKALAARQPEKLYKALQNLGADIQAPAGISDNLAYLYKTLSETSSGAEYLYQQTRIYRSMAAYPSHALGQHLKQIAELIISGSHTQVYYCELGGFDTHIAQKGQQGNLLRQYSEAVSVFVSDLKKNGRFSDTVIMTFSEFGRRVKQNASGGTDHGTANNVFVIHEKPLKAGILNETPDLSDLDEGDLKHTIDFRRIYAGLLEDVLQTDSQRILGKNFDPLRLI